MMESARRGRASFGSVAYLRMVMAMIEALQVDEGADRSARLRRECGEWLRARRIECGISTGELARLVKARHSSVVSLIESGRSRIAPEGYRDWAVALRMPAREFAKQMLQYHDPMAYRILFGPTL